MNEVEQSNNQRTDQNDRTYTTFHKTCHPLHIQNHTAAVPCRVTNFKYLPRFICGLVCSQLLTPGIAVSYH